jgi:hypothetical protein
MKFFDKSQLVSTSPAIIEKAKEFTNQVIGTVDYSDSQQSNKQKVWHDHFISKIGEEAVYKIYTQFTDNITKPDYKIYHGKNKNWDADIKVNNVDLAVKTQTKSSADKFGLSWTFQWGLHRKDIILDQPDSWVCFVKCDDTNSRYNCIVYPAMQIKYIIFGEPKIARLRGEKKVVYAKDNNII